MAEKIKVAHVIRVFSYGGAEVLLREFFASPQFKKAVVSDLFILDHKKLGLISDVKNNVRNIFFYKISSLLFPLEYIRFLSRLSRNNYDIVHMHLPVAGWMSILAKAFCPQTKFIYTEHNPVTSYAKYNYYLNGFAYCHFDAVIFMSQDSREVVEKIQNKWFHKTVMSVTILNGIDTKKYNNSHRVLKAVSDKWTVGLVARFRPQKRVDRWVDVAEALLKLNPAVTFIMAGDGPDDAMLRKKIAGLGLTQHFTLPGAVSDTASLHKQLDIFLMTSDFEGLPIALLEAMACGCVPVVHNVGGIQQLNIDEFGYRYNNFDALHIATTIANYISDPVTLFERTRAGRHFVEKNYSLEKQVDETLALYNQLLNR